MSTRKKQKVHIPEIEQLVTQQPYTNEEGPIAKSYAYYGTLDADERMLLDHYKAEMDPDDWADKPLDITYTVINWILLHRSKNVPYVPTLVKEHALTKDQFNHQLASAKKMMEILYAFPRSTKSINVYRGDTHTVGEYLKMHKQVSIYSFLSTSVNLSVATRFNKGSLLVIHIPAGNPLPFISDRLNEASVQSESEVLLPLGCTFVVNGYYEDVMINGTVRDVFYLTLVKFGPHDTRHFWSKSERNADRLYELYKRKVNSNSNNSNSNNNNHSRRQNGNGKKNRSRKQKRMN